MYFQYQVMLVAGVKRDRPMFDLREAASNGPSVLADILAFSDQSFPRCSSRTCPAAGTKQVSHSRLLYLGPVAPSILNLSSP